MTSSATVKFERWFRVILPTAFAVFCAAFAAAVMDSSREGGAAGAVPGHTVARMKERVVSIMGNSA